MKFIKRLFLAFSFFVVLSLLAMTGGYFYLNNNLLPIDSKDKTNIIFRITEGESLSQTLRKLIDKKLIKDYNSARILSLVKFSGKHAKPGAYQVSKSMSFEQIFTKFVSGDVYRLYVTIPEGFSIKKIAKRLSKYGFSEKRFLEQAKLVNSEAFDDIKFYAKEEIYKKESLEGYLFPDTYDVADLSKDDQIFFMKNQLLRFQELIYDGAWKNRPADWKMTLHETLTLASIVELEAQKPEERDVIAGVFMNRLQQGIPLGSDPTVEYALGWHQTEKGLSFEDIKVKSPYNTYMNAGLPPGPIANPGLAVFKAVLNYKKTPYVYFVARGDGSHVFTETYAEHLKAQDRIVNGK